CATLLIQSNSITPKRYEIVVVDVDDKIVKSIVPKSMIDRVVKFDQNIYPPESRKNKIFRYQYSYNLLQHYANAKVVITARIHVALPSVGMGTPVIFVNLPESKLPGGGG